MKTFDFNINDYCTVVLTATGANILNMHGHESNENFKTVGIDLRIKTDYKAGDSYKDQFWGIMQLFGPYCQLAMESPFSGCNLKLHTRSAS